MYARFGGEFSETYRRNTARRWVLSLRLKAQYLFIFAGGLLAVFILTVILYLCGVNQLLCLVLCLAGCTLVVWQTFSMNRRYGQYGLMKRAARSYHPGFLVNRKTVFHLLKNRRYDQQA